MRYPYLRYRYLLVDYLNHKILGSDVIQLVFQTAPSNMLSSSTSVITSKDDPPLPETKQGY